MNANLKQTNKQNPKKIAPFLSNPDDFVCALGGLMPLKRTSYKDKKSFKNNGWFYDGIVWTY